MTQFQLKTPAAIDLDDLTIAVDTGHLFTAGASERVMGCVHEKRGSQWSLRPAMPRTDENVADWTDYLQALQVAGMGVMARQTRRDEGQPEIMAVKLCAACYDNLPSHVALDTERAAKRAAQQAAAEVAAEEALAEMIERGAAIRECTICEELFDAAEQVVVRYCTFCEAVFSGAEGRNCETCNRPFTRKVTAAGHESCVYDYDEDDEGSTEYEPEVVS